MTAILRAELRRLFRWLKDKGVTAVITGERGEGPLTRQGLEEYVSDCVILLDHRVERPGLDAPAAGRQVSRLAPRHQRVPVPDRRGRHLRAAGHRRRARPRRSSSERVSTGHRRARRDARRQGLLPRQQRAGLRARRAPARPAWPRISSTPPARRGERCLYFAFEESPAQIIRNMRSIGLDLQRWVDARAPAVRGRPPDALRAGDAPGDDVPGDRGAAPARRGRRPDLEPDQCRRRPSEVQAMLMRLVDLPQDARRSPRCSPT